MSYAAPSPPEVDPATASIQDRYASETGQYRPDANGSLTVSGLDELPATDG